MNRERILLLGLLILGLSQMAFDLLKFPSLKAVAAATGAAPAPKVFSTVKGLETFSTKFEVQWVEHGLGKSVTLSPEMYTGLKGPYNRRNAYGAALAYAPILADSEHTFPMLISVLNYAFCQESSALNEMGIRPDRSVQTFKVTLHPLDPALLDPSLKTDIQIRCHEK